MKDVKELQNFWRDHADEDLMMCTIIGKNGSGYRDLGAKKIIRQNGDNRGYLSGGCLDADIVRTAQENWAKAAFLKSFSTINEFDRLMGYQMGCAGIIEILFEPLPLGTERLYEYLPYGPKENIQGIEIDLNPHNLGHRRILKDLHQARINVFIDPWIEPLNLYVIGCGPNARPIAELASALGWNLNFIDYREGNTFLESENIRSQILPIPEIASAIPEDLRTAVVLMTHNYEADLQIMSQLNGKKFGYLGCIGPKKRFDTMKQDLPKFYGIEMDDVWAENVKAPAGLHQAHSAEDIAFSVIGEIQVEIGLQK